MQDVGPAVVSESPSEATRSLELQQGGNGIILEQYGFETGSGSRGRATDNSRAIRGLYPERWEVHCVSLRH